MRPGSEREPESPAGDPSLEAPGQARLPRPRGRWRRVLLAAVALLPLVFHQRLLTGAGMLLVADDPPARADYVLPLGADRGLDRAASLYRAGEAGAVLLVRGPRGRLEREHVLPPGVDIARRELARRAVPDAAVLVLPGESRGDWEAARRLGEWLRARPGATVVALCDRLGSRRERYILDAVLGADARRVYLRAEPHRRFDETNWWRHKEGVLHVLTASIQLGYARLAGEDKEPWREWDIDAYEKTLRPGG